MSYISRFGYLQRMFLLLSNHNVLFKLEGNRSGNQYAVFAEL